MISLMIAGLTIAFSALVLVPRLRRSIQEDKAGPGEVPKRGVVKQTKFSKESKLEGQDNAVFESDDEVAKRDEISLDPSKLIDDLKESTSARGSGAIKPPIMPKPAHLRRSRPVRELEEVDLSSDSKQVVIETSGGGNDDRGGSADRGNNDKGSNQAQLSRSSAEIDIAKLFSSLQIMTACFASFAHGTNDVSNAVAPLVPIWNIYANGFEDTARQTPVWILLFGGIGICTGLWAWGRSVMATVGDGLTKLTPAKGFAIELGAAMAVLAATKIGMPISTTHCKVGSVVIVGLVSSKFLSGGGGGCGGDTDKSEKAVDWKLFGNIAITWIVTVPAAALSSAVMMKILLWAAF